MQYQQICQNVIDGTFQLDFCKHRTNGTRESFIEKYQETLDLANGRNDGNWSRDRKDKSVEEVDQSMREFYQHRLEWDSEKPGIRSNQIGAGTNELYCFECGRRLFWIHEENKVALKAFYDGKHTTIDQCDWATPKSIKGTINVQSTLFFLNHLKMEDTPEGKEHSDEYDLNCTRGRAEISKYKETINVAYGQLGSSFGVYVNDDKTSILLADPYIEDHLCQDMTDEEYENRNQEELQQIEGHELVGEVSGGVWRWEVTDENTLNELFQNNYKEHISEEQFKMKVPKGKWDFEDLRSLRHAKLSDEHVYARFKLKN